MMRLLRFKLAEMKWWWNMPLAVYEGRRNPNFRTEFDAWNNSKPKWEDFA